MAATRYNVTLKAANNPSKRPTVTYFYVDSADTEAMAIAKANEIAGLMNGTVTGISKQVYHNTDADAPGFEGADAKANGGSDFDRVTVKSATGQTDQLSLPLLKHSITETALEAVIEGAAVPDTKSALVNRFGSAIGEVVAHRRSHVIE